MISKVHEKEKAIEFRKRGYTYNEILTKLPVAKSSLSLWLKDMPLTEKERKYLKIRKDSNISRGRIKAATANHQNRLEKEKLYAEEAKKEFYQKLNNPLFLIGIALYWAEGTKRSDSCSFMNSDVDMTKVFMGWLNMFGIKPSDLDYGLYIHRHYAHEQCENSWANALGISAKAIKIYFKPDSKQFKRRPNYQGCMRVRVKRGSKLLFKLKVWQNMLARKYGK